MKLTSKIMRPVIMFTILVTVLASLAVGMVSAKRVTKEPIDTNQSLEGETAVSRNATLNEQDIQQVSADWGEAVKSVSDTLVDPGDLLTYTIAITVGPNAGTYAISDMIPSGFSFVGVDGATYDAGTNSIEWTGLLGTGVVTIVEDFEGAFPPAGWVLTETGDVADPGFLQTSARAYSGSYSAFHDDDQLDTRGDSWMILPQIDVPAEGADLSFWENIIDAFSYLYHGIWVSTATNDPADFIELVALGASTEDTWEEAIVSLDAYAGQSIYVAFLYVGDWADEWYIDDVAYPGPISEPDTHVITLTLQAEIPGTYTNVALLEAFGQTVEAVAPEVEIFGPLSTWDKSVIINGVASNWDEGPFTVYDGDVVGIVDSVAIDYIGVISYTLSDEWTNSLTLSGYDMTDGSVITGMNTAEWTLTSGISNTTYVLTKTFAVNDENGFTDFITETIAVEESPVVTTRGIEFTIPMEAEIVVSPGSLSSTQSSNTAITQTLTISNVGNISLDWSLWELPAATNTPNILKAPEAPIDARQVKAADISAPKSIASVSDAVLFEEGFEGGIVPPTGWTLETQNNDATWQIHNNAPYSGTYSAEVLYDGNLLPQDEWLLSPEMNLFDTTLSFWSNGDPFWCRDTNDNCDLDVWLVVGEIGGGDDIYVGQADDSWPAGTPFIWAESVFDLSSLAPNGLVKIGFQYSGLDGQRVTLDNIMVTQHECGVIGDIPWILVDPLSGTTTRNSATDIDVVFDSTGMLSGNYTGTLCVSSNDVVNPIVEVPMTMVVPPQYGVELSADAAMSGAPGEVVTYTVAVTNTGNISDDFTIAISDTWGATAPVSVTVAAGASETFDVVVTVPVSTSDGDFDVAEVTVTSDSDASATASVDLTTTAVVEDYFIYLPVIIKPAP